MMTSSRLDVPLRFLSSSLVNHSQESKPLSSTNGGESTSSTKISCLVASPSSSAIFIGDTNGKLHKLSFDSSTSSTSPSRSSFNYDWKMNAQCGPIRGISVVLSYRQKEGEEFIAVFGEGDSCVNVFAGNNSSNNNNHLPTLRWQCTGHTFSVTAATLVSSSSSSPLVVTCSTDGLIRLFDLQRVSTLSVANVKSKVQNNNNLQQQQQKQIQLVYPLCHTSLPSSLNAIPKAILFSSSSSSILDQGNLLVWCEKVSESKEVTLIQLDVLGNQRTFDGFARMMKTSSGSSSGSLLQNTDLKREVYQTSDLLSIRNIVSLNEIFSSSSVSMCSSFFSWNSKQSILTSFSWKRRNAKKVDGKEEEGDVESSIQSVALTETGAMKLQTLDDNFQNLLESNENFVCFSQEDCSLLLQEEVRSKLHNCLKDKNTQQQQRQGNSKKISLRFQSAIANYHLLQNESGKRRERESEGDEVEAVVERCKETLSLIKDLKMEVAQ